MSELNSVIVNKVTEELDAKIPRDVIKSRDGGGKTRLDYLPTWYVIDRMNKVFGHLNWSSETVEMTEVHNLQKPTYRAKVRVTVHLTEKVSIVKEGFGYGNDKSTFNAHELAVKEAESDALKRACMKFGLSMGLALYARDEDFIDETGGLKHEPSTPEAKEESSVERKAEKSNSRETVLKLISATSKVILDRELSTQDNLIKLLGTKYGVETKDQLTMEAAEQLLTELKGMIR